jgi:hypothetical protein
MTREENFLVKICRAYLDNSPIDFPEDINYRELFKLAKHHNLLCVCHCVMNNSKSDTIPNDFSNAVKNKFFDSVYLYECQKNTIKDVEDILSASQTRYILFKGIRLREIYPVAESRTMGDIDVLIDKENRDKVKALLINAGFDCTEENGPVYNYRRDGVLLEVHTHIISEFGDDAFTDAFENSTFQGMAGTLDDSYHTAYLIAHTAHHFKFYGAGIRHVLDLAFIQSKRNVDINRVFEILKPLSLDTFAKVILTVCYRWFNVGQDFGVDTDKTMDYLCKCGVFGSMQENTGAIVTRKDMEQAGDSSSFKVKLRLAFPSYEKMKNINYIKFIDGRPWLTPYAWCYRFFYNIKHRKQFMTKTISEIDDETTRLLAKQELEYFEEIGLV